MISGQQWWDRIDQPDANGYAAVTVRFAETRDGTLHTGQEPG